MVPDVGVTVVDESSSGTRTGILTRLVPARLKAQELANYIICRRTDLDFSEPEPVLPRTDSEAIRSRILSMTTTEAKVRGMRKNTLWHLQHRACRSKPFRISGKVMVRISQAS